MKRYIPILKNTQLFSGASDEDIEAMLGCLQARLCTYKKGEYVLREGERIERLMMLVKGELHIQRDDYWGNRSIISMVGVGEMFGEAYAAPESGPLMNDVLAVEDSAVIFLDIGKLLTVCPNGCKFHAMAVKNLFFAISEKKACPKARIYVAPHNTRKADSLSFRRSEAAEQRRVFHTVQPSAACGFSVRRPQRNVERAVQAS